MHIPSKRNNPDRNNLRALHVPVALPLLVLAFCLLVTGWLWRNEKLNVMQVMQTRFDSRVKEFENLTANRVHDYKQVLQGMRGLFAASTIIERGEFREYAATLNLKRNFPGAQGMCYSMIVPAAQKDRHIASVHKQGFPEYSIRPETPRDFYTTAIFLEPFSGRNQRAFGFDNFTDATRRAAMELARDTGELSISGKVHQLHEGNEDQSGFRMYLPVYRNGASTLTLDERRKNILGWLYMPIRMDDFMNDALGDRAGRLDVEIYDGEKTTPETLMYDSDPSHVHLSVESAALFKTVKPVNLNGHTWTLAAHSLPGFDARIEEGRQNFIMYSGVGISQLLAALVGLLLYGRARIMRDAQAVAHSEARLSAVIETALDAVIQMDSDGRVIGWNSQAELMFGWSREKALGQSLDAMIIPSAHRKTFLASMNKFLVAPENFTVSGQGSALNARSELSALRQDGRDFPIELSMTQNTLDDGSYQFTAFIRDITKRREREEAQRLAGTVLNTVEEAVLVTDTENRIVKVNPAFTVITGYTAEEVIGKNPRMLSSGKHPSTFYREMWEAVNVNGLWQGEIWDRRKSGEIYVKWLTIKTVLDEKGALTHYLGVFSDISERKEAEERMKRLAHHDALTGLPNRNLFNDRLHQAMSKARRDQGRLALMFIDLDNFKPVNDTFGHAAGDLLLQGVAARLLRCVRTSDTVSRIGGDEFVILVSSIEGGHDASLVAGKVLHTLNEPFELEGQRLSISASIGIAIYPEHGDNELLLTNHADIAMYNAKNSGRNNAMVYQPGMQKI